MIDGSPRGVWSRLIPQRAILEAMQRDDQFVYAAITRENAVKIGITTNLMNRKSGIRFGGVERYIGFMPAGIRDERRLHRSLDGTGARIAGTREYYYPFPDVLPAINELRASMGIRPLRRRDLPRPASCSFHRRVAEAQTRGTSVFS